MKKIFIILAVIVVSISFIIFSIVTLFKFKEPSQSLINENYQSKMSENLKQQLINDFDNKTNLTKNKVIAGVKKYYTNEYLTEVSIDNGSGTYLDYSINGGKSKIEGFVSTIPENANYKSELVENNGKITGIKFTKN